MVLVKNSRKITQLAREIHLRQIGSSCVFQDCGELFFQVHVILGLRQHEIMSA